MEAVAADKGSRRARLAGKTRATRKTSIRLDAALYEEMASYIAETGGTQTAFVDDAIRLLLRTRHRAELAAQYEAAANDPAFMSEMSVVDAAFDAAAGDGLE